MRRRLAPRRYLIEASDWAERYFAEGAVREDDREAVTAALVEAAPDALGMLSEITFAAGRDRLRKEGLWYGDVIAPVAAGSSRRR